MRRTFRLSWLVIAIVLASAPTLADQYLIYTQGGIPIPGAADRTTELWTWCSQGQPCVEELSVCGGPEGERSLRADAGVWGGMGFFLNVQNNATPGVPPVDLSQYMGGVLKFWIKTPPAGIGNFGIKVEMQCEPGPAPGIDTHTVSIGDHGWDGTSDFQELTIPLGAFSTDPACFQNVVSPFMATIENLPFFNSFFIDYVRWETPVANPGRSIVTTQGRQLFVDGEPFVVNGVAYSPLGVGQNWAAAWADRPDRYNIDFPLMAANGVNTVRLYAPVVSKAMLDAAWANGLYVIPQFGIDPPAITCPTGQANTIDRFVEMVNTWKDHPAILFWLIGNEVNANLGPADLCLDWYPTLDAMAAAAHAAEGTNFHPVGTAVADVPDICVPGCSDDTALPNVDLWGMQIYRGCSTTTAYNDYDNKVDCNRPVIVTETGVDAYNSGTASEDQIGQSACLSGILSSGNAELAVLGAGNVSSGQVVFSWHDEWWKADDVCGTGWEFHDGCTSFTNNSYPDPGMNEEWWGLVGLNDADADDRLIRTAYTTAANAWFELGPVENLNATSYNGGSGAVGIAYMPAESATDHTLYYGPLNAVSTYGYSGSVTGLGTSGSGSATLPAGSHFFMVVGQVHGAEGCYGSDSSCNERPASPGAVNPQSANRYCSACP